MLSYVHNLDEEYIKFSDAGILVSDIGFKLITLKYGENTDVNTNTNVNTDEYDYEYVNKMHKYYLNFENVMFKCIEILLEQKNINLSGYVYDCVIYTNDTNNKHIHYVDKCYDNQFDQIKQGLKYIPEQLQYIIQNTENVIKCDYKILETVSATGMKKNEFNKLLEYRKLYNYRKMKQSVMNVMNNIDVDYNIKTTNEFVKKMYNNDTTKIDSIKYSVELQDKNYADEFRELCKTMYDINIDKIYTIPKFTKRYLFALYNKDTIDQNTELYIYEKEMGNFVNINIYNYRIPQSYKLINDNFELKNVKKQKCIDLVKKHGELFDSPF